MEWVLIPLVALSIPIVIVPTVLGLRHARFLRQVEHAERMKAMELRRTLPQDEPWWTPARISVTIGAGVPVGALAAACLATGLVGFREEAWGISGAVGMFGVVAGSVLAAKHFAHRARVEGRVSDVGYYAKPGVEDDAFDVVGRRG